MQDRAPLILFLVVLLAWVGGIIWAVHVLSY